MARTWRRRRTSTRQRVVAGLGSPAGEGLLLGDPAPLTGELPQPHLTRIPGQLAADRLQFAW